MRVCTICNSLCAESTTAGCEHCRQGSLLHGSRQYFGGPCQPPQELPPGSMPLDYDTIEYKKNGIVVLRIVLADHVGTGPCL